MLRIEEVGEVLRRRSEEARRTARAAPAWWRAALRAARPCRAWSPAIGDALRVDERTVDVAATNADLPLVGLEEVLDHLRGRRRILVAPREGGHAFEVGREDVEELGALERLLTSVSLRHLVLDRRPSGTRRELVTVSTLMPL